MKLFECSLADCYRDKYMCIRIDIDMKALEFINDQHNDSQAYNAVPYTKNNYSSIVLNRINSQFDLLKACNGEQ